MSDIAFCQYAKFIDVSGSTPAYGSYQNFFIGESKTYLEVSYAFLPFVIGAGVGETGGDRPSTTFVFPRSQISASVLTEAVDNFWELQVDTVMIDKMDYSQIALFLSETWICDSYNQDDRNGRIITLQLSSPFDAIQTQIPPLVLTERLVGSVPAGGVINVG